MQLPRCFDAEFGGLVRTTGHTLQLPNLIAERPLEVAFSLQVLAQPEQQEIGATRVRLAWMGRGRARREVWVQLNLPVVPAEAYARLPEHEEVRVARELQRNAQARRDAVSQLDTGDLRGDQQLPRPRQQVFVDVPPLCPQACACRN